MVAIIELGCIEVVVLIEIFGHKKCLDFPPVPCVRVRFSHPRHRFASFAPSSNLLLVCPLRRIIPRTNNQALALARPTIHGLQDINQLLLGANRKVDLVVISRAKVDLHVLVAPEEHDSARIIDFVHGVEVWDLLFT